MASLNDFRRHVRGGAVAHLKADTAVTDLVAADSVYGPEPPPERNWPFLSVRTPSMTPTEASGWTGGQVDGRVHVFARDLDECDKIAERVAASIDGADLDLAEPGEAEAPACLEVWHTNTVTVGDTAEPNAYHAVVDFTVLAAESLD